MTTTLDTNDRITLGQCYNLAHNEAIAKQRTDIDEYLKKRTIELFHIKRKIENYLTAKPVAEAARIFKQKKIDDI